MGTPKGSVRMRWSLDCLKCFLEACIHEVTKVGRKEGSLHVRSWKYVQKQLHKVCNLKVMQKQMKNAYDYLKWKFLGWAYLKRKVGNLYNSKTNTFNLTEEEWRDFVKEHPKAKTLRSSPLVFPNLCIILFERTFTLGELRWSPMSRVSPSSLKSPNIPLLAIEGIPHNSQDVTVIKNVPDISAEADTLNPSTIKSPNLQLHEDEDIDDNNQEDGIQTRSAQYSQSSISVPPDNVERPNALNSNLGEERPKKKCKTVTRFSQLEEESPNELNIFTKTRVGPSQEECVNKLNQLGWAKNCASYVAALGIFCEGPDYREGWMLLPVDNVELIELWVASVGKKLGYL